jgi:hypothetical protein
LILFLHIHINFSYFIFIFNIKCHVSIFVSERFIELIKDKYPKLTKILRCFDPRKSVEKTKYNQIQYHPYGIIVYIDDKKTALDYTKLIDIYNTDDISDVQYEIVITMSECKSRIININKTFQLLEVITENKRFVTKDNKTIEYYPAKIINANNKIFNDMINKKKEYLFGTIVDQNEYEEIEFA